MHEKWIEFSEIGAIMSIKTGLLFHFEPSGMNVGEKQSRKMMYRK